MKAVVLAAGEGTRLRPKTHSIPKPLVEVAGKPLLSRCFDTVHSMGIDEVVVVVGYEKEQIIDHYRESHHGITIQYAHQDERMGLAHAVSCAGEYIDSDVLVVNGDNLYAGNVAAIVNAHREADSNITIPVQEVSRERAKKGAVCEFDDSGVLVGLCEKPDQPPSTTVPIGMYILPPEIVPACAVIRPSERGEYELPDAIDLLITEGYTVRTVEYDGWRINVNTDDDVRRAEEYLQERNMGK